MAPLREKLAALLAPPSEERRRLLTVFFADVSGVTALSETRDMARVQGNPAEALRWNQEALDRADAVGDDRVRGFYPSLYLNMGKAYEDVGARDDARRYYTRAAESIGDLADDGYGAMVRCGIAAGL